MTIIQQNRKSNQDVYHANILKNNNYAGEEEIPVIRPYTGELPKQIIPFSKRKSYPKESWIGFYEDDIKFQSIWNKPKKYLKELKKYGGVITPDFSIFRDMPLTQQKWNIFRNRAIGAWLQRNGINVIPNIRWGDERTFEAACLGISEGSTICVGSHGFMRDKEEKKHFTKGLDAVIDKLGPKKVLVYGTLPDDVFKLHQLFGIEFLAYPSEIKLYHKGGI